MPSLTDGAIRQAIKQVQKSGRQKSLTDGEGRGTGRLVLTLKPMPRRVTAEWMAQQWRDGRRSHGSAEPEAIGRPIRQATRTAAKSSPLVTAVRND